MKRKVAVSETQSVGPRLTQTQLYRKFNYFPHPETAEINAVITKKEFDSVQGSIAIVFLPSKGQDRGTLDYVFDNIQSLRFEVDKVYSGRSSVWAGSLVLHAPKAADLNGLNFSNFEFLKILTDPLPTSGDTDSSYTFKRDVVLLHAGYALQQYTAQIYSESYLAVVNFLASVGRDNLPDWAKLDKAAERLDLVVKLEENYLKILTQIVAKRSRNDVESLDPVKADLLNLNIAIEYFGKRLLGELIGESLAGYLLRAVESVAGLGGSLNAHLSASKSDGRPPRIVTQANFWNHCFLGAWQSKGWEQSLITWDAEKNDSRLLFGLLGIKLIDQPSKKNLERLLLSVERMSKDFILDCFWKPNFSIETSLRMVSLLESLNRINSENPSTASWIEEFVKKYQTLRICQFISGAFDGQLNMSDALTKHSFDLRNKIFASRGFVVSEAKNGSQHSSGGLQHGLPIWNSTTDLNDPSRVNPVRGRLKPVNSTLVNSKSVGPQPDNIQWVSDRSKTKKDDESKQTRPEYPMLTSRIYLKETSSARLQRFFKSKSSKFIGKTRYFFSQLFRLTQVRTN